MSRWRAAAIHLAISFFILAFFMALMLGLWYPPPYFQAIDATGLISLLVGVDLVAGPLLTLIVFKSGKKTLKFDLSVIALIQLSLLLYGTHAVVIARPAFIVFAVDRFEVVQAKDVDVTQAVVPEFNSLPWTGPKLAAAIPPENPEERQTILFSAVMAGVDIQNLSQYYRPYADAAQQAVARGKPLATLSTKGDEAKQAVTDFLHEYGGQAEDFVYLPIRTGHEEDMAMVLRRADGEPVTELRVDPW